MLTSTFPIPGSLPASKQLNDEGQLKHFLTLDGLSTSMLENILQTATSFQEIATKPVKKVPLLRGKTVFNLFFETSTRTRTTFELAAKRLSADVMNVNISQSATSKGESLLDTIRNIEAMHTDMFIVRHAQSGAAQFIAQQVAPHISVVNAGDGWHSHPTQAMLDMLTIQQYKKSFEHLKVAIVGDVLHSRVARSQIQALSILGAAEVRVVAPKTLLPAQVSKMGVHVYHSMKAGIADVDVIIMLRLQKERMSGAFIPSESEYFNLYGLNQTNLQLAKPDAIVMHPGPTNRGVEIAADVADGKRSVILQQVSNGLAMRMAIISMCLGATKQSGVIT